MYDVKSSIDWLCRSIDVNNGRGSSLSYSLVRKPWAPWFPPYPETTGYITETLFDYARFEKYTYLEKYALSCADWLMEIQSPSGGYHGSMLGKVGLSVFNSGMILIGLVRAFKETKERKYFETSESVATWLLENIDRETGIWQKYSYVKGYTPTYYSRLVWALLQYCEVTRDAKSKLACERCLDILAERFDPSALQYRDWSFFPGQSAFTHTIAYTLRGFIESSAILGRDDLLETSLSVLGQISEIVSSHNVLAGSYDRNWQGDYSFKCLTGQCQIAYLLLKYGSMSGKNNLQIMGRELIEDVRKYLRKGRVLKAIRGALPGSYPYYGKYMPLHHPNWGVKFYLDAELQLARTAGQASI